MQENEEDNIVRRLRLALRMTQTQFAAELEMSTQSVQNYERGQRLSETAAKRMQQLAADRGLVELGFELGGGLPGVTKVLGPKDVGRRSVRREPRGTDLLDSLHADVDWIVQHGDAETVAAVDALLKLVRKSLSGGRR